MTMMERHAPSWGLTEAMRHRATFTRLIGTLALAAAGCAGTNPSADCELWTAANFTAPTVAVPHSRFHPAPTRPVFAPPIVGVAGEGGLPFVPRELLEPPQGAPAIGNREIEETTDELPAPEILEPPVGPVPRASSRRVPGMKYF